MRATDMKRASAALLASICLAALAARANPFELFGYTPRAMGLGNAMVGVADDLAGSFYNPAGLLGHTKTEFGIGFADTISSLHIDRTNNASAASSAQVESSPRFELGLIFPLGGALFKDRVVIGIGGGHPVGSLVRVQTVDQSHPQFYMYQSKPQRFALTSGIGIKIINGLSIGGGVQVLAQQVGTVNFALDIASRRFRQRDITVDLNTVVTPIAGLLIEPNDSIKIGLSWRREAKLYYAQPTTIDLGDTGKLALDVQGLAQYWPDVFSAGVSVKPSRRLMVSAQVDYLRWSRSPNDQVTVKVTPSGGLISGFGLDSILGFGSQDAHPGFSDILVPHLGIEFAATDLFTVRAGGWVRPAVTPDQNGTTNYLDNFTEAVSAGLSFRFQDPLKVFTDPVTLDLGGQLIFANERTNRKQAADPTGGASYGGQLYSFSGMLRYLY
jgi:long-subunit fatty acid transport protein